MRLILAVDVAGGNSVAGPMVAAALAYEPRTRCPEFTYNDEKGVLRRATLETLLPLYATGAVNHVRRSTCGCATVHMAPEEVSDLGVRKASLELMGRAVVRVVERVLHHQGDALRGTALDELQLHLPGNELLSSQYVAAGVRQVPSSQDWRREAALLFARVSHAHLLYALAERYPGYGLERNGGRLTREHREALRKLGPSPIHRTASNVVRLFSRRTSRRKG